MQEDRLSDEVPFPLNSVWEREYSPEHWIVFYVCEVNDAMLPDDGRRAGRLLAKHDPLARTGLNVCETFRFDWNTKFAHQCKRIA